MRLVDYKNPKTKIEYSLYVDEDCSKDFQPPDLQTFIKIWDSKSGATYQDIADPILISLLKSMGGKMTAANKIASVLHTMWDEFKLAKEKDHLERAYTAMAESYLELIKLLVIWNGKLDFAQMLSLGIKEGWTVESLRQDYLNQTKEENDLVS